MKHFVETKWLGETKFSSMVDNHEVLLDLPTNENSIGPSPKKLMLTALAGCTGLDVISILKKMKVEFDELSINIDAELTEEHPKHYTNTKIIYSIKGKDLDEEKIRKAINLSLEKYCGVYEVYRKSMNITYELVIN